jgi:hypothetical protein
VNPATVESCVIHTNWCAVTVPPWASRVTSVRRACCPAATVSTAGEIAAELTDGATGVAGAAGAEGAPGLTGGAVSPQSTRTAQRPTIAAAFVGAHTVLGIG